MYAIEPHWIVAQDLMFNAQFFLFKYFNKFNFNFFIKMKSQKKRKKKINKKRANKQKLKMLLFN